ncbi:MAG TPA: glycoside hydrolase family 16 protein [Flavobacteriales bacterium]|nr:glycoside hydrolase family 16 protein [Flavobacteriales bacterium]
MIHDLTAFVKPAFCGLLLSLVAQASLLAQCDYGKREAATTDGVCNSNPWVLVFEDNFDGYTINLNNWSPESGGRLQGAPGQEYLSPENVRVSNGKLHLDVKEETVIRKAVNWKPETEVLEDSIVNLRKYYFTAASLTSKEDFSYGRYEIRCRIPRGKGYWPAFWTFGGDGGWNEIDVFEFWDYYGPGGTFKLDKSVRRHRTNTHYDFEQDGGHDNCPKHKYLTDFSVGMHTFELIWTPYTIEWIVDGKSVRKKFKYSKGIGLNKIDCENYRKGKRYKVDKAFPTQKMKIIVNVAVRTKGVVPNATDTSFPGVMDVDYIRYYKR